ncbi:MAG: DUF503 domain-containing protein [Candidatus Omnitrophica bacterium]|nr:DUF503 domain-containing protein [Candidatus Omnitrophota bacterium]MCM8788709.1 DUF503 domain-containing protein [Candidatus Omnitrophota bacterium]
MVVGVWKIELHMPYAQNLKDKRNLLQSILVKSRNRFNVSIAEVDYHDKWQRSMMGIACVDHEICRAKDIFTSIRKILEENGSVVIVKEDINFFPLEND